MQNLTNIAFNALQGFNLTPEQNAELISKLQEQQGQSQQALKAEPMPAENENESAKNKARKKLQEQNKWHEFDRKCEHYLINRVFKSFNGFNYRPKGTVTNYTHADVLRLQKRQQGCTN